MIAFAAALRFAGGFEEKEGVIPNGAFSVRPRWEMSALS
jgi:hypothetical protein